MQRFCPAPTLWEPPVSSASDKPESTIHSQRCGGYIPALICPDGGAIGAKGGFNKSDEVGVEQTGPSAEGVTDEKGGRHSQEELLKEKDTVTPLGA